MISLDAIKGLLAEHWKKDACNLIEKLVATDAMDRPHIKTPHWPSHNQPRIRPASYQ